MKYVIRSVVAMFCAMAFFSPLAFAEKNSGECNFTPKYGRTLFDKDHEGMFLRKAHLILMKANELGLSDEQIQKIKTLDYNLKKSFIKDDADIKSLALDTREATGKDDIDLNTVNSLIDKKYAAKAEKVKDDIQAYANLKKILTLEQNKKLKEMRFAGMKERFWHGRDLHQKPVEK